MYYNYIELLESAIRINGVNCTPAKEIAHQYVLNELTFQPIIGAYRYWIKLFTS